MYLTATVCNTNLNFIPSFSSMKMPEAQPGFRLKVNEAQLWMQKLDVLSSSSYVVTVSMLNVTSRRGFRPAEMVIVDTLMVRPSSAPTLPPTPSTTNSTDGWITLDVTAAVKEWLTRWPPLCSFTPAPRPHLPGVLVVEVVDQLKAPLAANTLLRPSPCRGDRDQTIKTLNKTHAMKCQV